MLNYNRILKLYKTTILHNSEIAARFNCSKMMISKIVYKSLTTEQIYRLKVKKTESRRENYKKKVRAKYAKNEVFREKIKKMTKLRYKKNKL